MASNSRAFIPSLFSFKGRIRRRHYWVTSFALGIVKAVLTVIVAIVVGAPSLTNGDSYVRIVVEALFLWPALALMVKRGHDRNRPARFSLVMLVVAIAMIMGAGVGTALAKTWLMTICVVGALAIFGFLLVDYGFMDGTPGPNRYGPSPKGVGAESLDVAATFD